MTTPRPTQPSAAGDFADVSADELVVGELTAALVDAERSEHDTVPPALADRLVVTGEAVVRATRSPAMSASPSPTRRPSIMAWTGWLAAAALLAVTVVRSRAPQAPATAATPAMPTAALDGDVRLLRATLVADAKTVTLKWAPGSDSTGRFIEDGEVLWSPSLQKGVMRLIGLMPNDSTQWQYQLWIFDKTRDERYPVDGGVFNIAKGQADRLVPIRARIPVGDAVMFAITVEKPGGVVVSTRERLAMLAKL
jgi:hypothetical protein